MGTDLKAPLSSGSCWFKKEVGAATVGSHLGFGTPHMLCKGGGRAEETPVLRDAGGGLVMAMVRFRTFLKGNMNIC